MPRGLKLTWKGQQVTQQIKQGLVNGVTEIDLQIEAEAKAELYPGHGKRTGIMQRSIQGQPGRLEGDKIRGSVGTKGVPYALIQHRRYQYMTNGLQKVRPRTMGILKRNVKGSA